MDYNGLFRFILGGNNNNNNSNNINIDNNINSNIIEKCILYKVEQERTKQEFYKCEHINRCIELEKLKILNNNNTMNNNTMNIKVKQEEKQMNDFKFPNSINTNIIDNTNNNHNMNMHSRKRCNSPSKIGGFKVKKLHKGNEFTVKEEEEEGIEQTVNKHKKNVSLPSFESLYSRNAHRRTQSERKIDLNDILKHSGGSIEQ